MRLRFSLWMLGWVSVALLLPLWGAQKGPSAPPSTAARTLLLPRQVVAGEHATLAVLDINGRLTPDVSVSFSSGDHVKTDDTGRALFVAPLNPGVIFGSIDGRPGHQPIVILTSAEAATSSIEISSAPREASLTDRFEVVGKGFCGDADANQAKVSGRPALVLASSPVYLAILPPADLDPGGAAVELACANRRAHPFSLSFIELELEANAAPLKPNEHRGLIVRVRGSEAKVSLEARNLAPGVATLIGGDTATASSSGGKDNFARFELIGRKNGSFQISIRLVPTLAPSQ